MTDKHV